MRVTLEEAVDLFSEDESDGDDLDDLFTQEELEEEAEEADVDSGDEDDDSAGTFRSSSSGAPASRQSSERSSPDPPPKRPKRSKLLVLSIEDALDPDKFDRIEIPEGSASKTFSANLGPTKKKNVQKIRWVEKACSEPGRQRACDVVKGIPDLRTQAAKDVSSMRKAFDLFITPAMVDKIVTSTNEKIEETIAGLSEEVLEDSTKPYICLTDGCEMYALFGLMYFRGLLGQSKHQMNDIFSGTAGRPVFGGSMSRKAFRKT